MTSDYPESVKEFLRLFSAHQQQIHMFLLTLIPHRADAEEVLQDTSVTLLEKFDQFQLGTDFAAWACAIAKLKALEFYRRNKRSSLMLTPVALENVAEAAARCSEQTNPRLDALDKCVKTLSPKDRQLIQRRYEPGVTATSLAEELERPVRSVYKSIGRVRKWLLRCVERKLSQ